VAARLAQRRARREFALVVHQGSVPPRRIPAPAGRRVAEVGRGAQCGGPAESPSPRSGSPRAPPRGPGRGGCGDVSRAHPASRARRDGRRMVAGRSRRPGRAPGVAREVVSRAGAAPGAAPRRGRGHRRDPAGLPPHRPCPSAPAPGEVPHRAGRDPFSRELPHRRIPTRTAIARAAVAHRPTRPDPRHAATRAGAP